MNVRFWIGDADSLLKLCSMVLDFGKAAGYAKSASMLEGLVMQGFESRWKDFPDYILGITKEIWEDRCIGQESAAIDLLRTAARQRGESRTVFETAARSDPKGNGGAEKAVQSIEEMLRTLMVDLEDRCGEPLSVTEPFFEWLMEHACDLLNKFHVRKGNKTAWEALKEKPYTGDVY